MSNLKAFVFITTKIYEQAPTCTLEGVVPKNWLTLKGNEYYVHLPPGTVSEIDNLACTSTPPSKDTWQMQFCIVEQTSGKFIINHILYEACLKI